MPDRPTHPEAAPLRALDLFCGAGGASAGLHAAGFTVDGADVEEQPEYPFSFERRDALSFNIATLQLCGSTFGLDVQRHRLFETSVPLVAPRCAHHVWTPRFAQATNRANKRKTVEVGVYRIPLAVQRKAMGIEWMSLARLSQAIPPAYATWLGLHMRREVVRRVA